jgi:LuxR family maltose regulon positive regulatory protein
LSDGAYLAWSLLSLEANELELAREQVERALVICTQGDVVSGVLWGQFILARVRLAYGDIEALREVCQQAYRLAVLSGREGLQGAWFLALEAQASLQQGDVAAAAAWATTANAHLQGASQPWSDFSRFVYTRVLLAESRIDEARELLDAMAEQARDREQRRSLITIYLLQARVEIALGHDAQALALVEQALRLASPQGYRRAFLDEGEPIAEMLERNRHIAPDFVASLLADTPTDCASSGGRGVPSLALTEPLTPREREILRLITAGRSNPEIASLLYLSLNTVKWHASNLYGKLGVSNRVEAVTRARDLDLL